MKLKKIQLAFFAASAIVVVPASAGVLGAADLAVLSLALVNAQGTPIVGGINVVGDQRTGSANADFNGVVGSGTGNGSITSNAIAGTVDVKYRCAGPDCAAAAALYAGGTQAVGTAEAQPENNMTTNITSPTLNYALGDMVIAGSAVSGPGANGLTRADSSVAGATNIGGASGSINNAVSARSEVTFTLLGGADAGTSEVAQFALSYDVFRKVFIDPLNPSNTTGAATAGTTFILTLTSTDPTFAPLVWMPDPLNGTFSAFSSGDNAEVNSAGTLLSEFRTLNIGFTYNLTVIQSSLSSASQIPEPGSVLLIGLGLFGLAQARRRFK